MERTSLSYRGMTRTVAGKPGAGPLHRERVEGGIVEVNLSHASPRGYWMWNTSGQDSFVPMGPHRLFFHWENSEAMCRVNPWGSETPPEEATVYPDSCAPLPVAGHPRSVVGSLPANRQYNRVSQPQRGKQNLP